MSAALLAQPVTAWSQGKKYDTGATDTEIKIGQTIMYSGAASAAGIIGKVQVAYWKMINERGGINGRKVNLLSVDDGSSPPKTVEATRKLVEQDNVLAIMGSACTSCAIAVQSYLNQKKIPQLFLTGSAPVLHDPKNSPWTIPFLYAYETEGELFGGYIREKYPNAKIGILSQNDDVGRSVIKGLRKALGPSEANIIKEVTYDIGDPTSDPQVLALKDAGIEVFVNLAVNKYVIQSIRRVVSLTWKPTAQLILDTQIGSGVLGPAGLENAVGIVSSAWIKQPDNPAYANDKDVIEYREFMKKYLPSENADNSLTVYSYVQAQIQALVLERCKDDLTRDNLLKQSTSLSGVKLAMMMPGAQIDVSPDNYYPIRKAVLIRFDGKQWNLLDK
jgi:ABC-type branched-subunit amino acid transport system substrate-binding protein